MKKNTITVIYVCAILFVAASSVQATLITTGGGSLVNVATSG